MIDDRNEDFDQKRFITAMVISGLVLILWQTFFAPELPPPTEQTQTAEQIADKKTEKEKEPTAKLDDQPKSDVVEKKFKPAKHVLALDGTHVTLTNRDASMISAKIDQPEQYQAAGDLLAGLPEDASAKPFMVRFGDESIPIKKDVHWEVVDTDQVREGEFKAVTYRYTDPQDRFQIDKVFTPGDGRYLMNLEVKITNRLTDAKLSGTPLLDMAGFQDPDKETSWFDFRPDDWEALCKTDEDMERALHPQLEEEEVVEGKTMWGGINLRYTVLGVIPENGAKGCTLKVTDENLVHTVIPSSVIDISPGETGIVRYRAFVGPKDYDVLTDAGAKMEEAVDYGLLTFICRPMRWALLQCYKVTGNWGWAILLLTVVIRTFLWPVNQKVYGNSERMKDIQPKMQALREKHKDDQQRMTEETMKLMKENNVSMLGCAPMLLQMPILLAFYWTILYSAELYQATWAFWYTDLSAPDEYYVLPILMGITMFFQQRLMPTPEGPQAKQMQTMMRVMPIMMTVFMLFLPSGVVLYYFLSLLIGLVQQVLIKKKFREQREATTA